MHHRMADFHSGRKAVEEQSADLRLKDGDQVAVCGKIFFGAVDGRREVSL